MNLLQALVKTEGDFETAKEIIEEMILELIDEGCNPEDILDDRGLEPDYVFDLIDYASGKKIVASDLKREKALN